jgi:hypothetical protein
VPEFSLRRNLFGHVNRRKKDDSRSAHGGVRLGRTKGVIMLYRKILITLFTAFILALGGLNVANADIPDWFWGSLFTWADGVSAEVDEAQADVVAMQGQVDALTAQVAMVNTLVVLDNNDDVVGPAIIDLNVQDEVWAMVDTSSGPFMVRMQTDGPAPTTLYYLAHDCPGNNPQVTGDADYQQGLIRPALAVVIENAMYAGDTDNINCNLGELSFRDSETEVCNNISGACTMPLISIGDFPSFQAPFRVKTLP